MSVLGTIHILFADNIDGEHAAKLMQEIMGQFYPWRDCVGGERSPIAQAPTILMTDPLQRAQKP